MLERLGRHRADAQIKFVERRLRLQQREHERRDDAPDPRAFDAGSGEIRAQRLFGVLRAWKSGNAAGQVIPSATP